MLSIFASTNKQKTMTKEFEFDYEGITYLVYYTTNYEITVTDIFSETEDVTDDVKLMKAATEEAIERYGDEVEDYSREDEDVWRYDELKDSRI